MNIVFLKTLAKKIKIYSPEAVFVLSKTENSFTAYLEGEKKSFSLSEPFFETFPKFPKDFEKDIYEMSKLEKETKTLKIKMLTEQECYFLPGEKGVLIFGENLQIISSNENMIRRPHRGDRIIEIVV